jgi:hypothetical protein
MKKYREISLDTELELCLSACDCDGYDIVHTFRKEQRLSCEYAACVCGARRGRRKPQGGWSVVIDDAIRASIKKSFDPLKMEPIIEQSLHGFSITGNPDGSPIDNAKKGVSLP